MLQFLKRISSCSSHNSRSLSTLRYFDRNTIIRNQLSASRSYKLPKLDEEFEKAILRPSLQKTRSIDINNRERLEFLGDRVINLLAAEIAYFIVQPNGKNCASLQIHYEAMINNEGLGELAEKVGLRREIEKVGKQELSKHRLADRFEAWMGALYLTGKEEVMVEFLVPHLYRKLSKLK